MSRPVVANAYVSTLLQKSGWIALVIIFLFAGILGHDPWKQDETYSFGIIYHFYTTHTWLVPTDAGQPFMEKPPLYYWLAVCLCKLLGAILPLHEAARTASFLCMAVTCIFAWKLSQVLFRNERERSAIGWMTIALLLGSIGLVRHAHDMFTDVALLTGTTIALYGMALLICLPDKWKPAAVWFGLGIGVAFMTKGFFLPVVLGLSCLILWGLLPEMKTRRTLRATLLALLVASPFIIIWPALLYQYDPKLFMIWFWDNNIGRFLGFSVARLGADNTPFYSLYTVIWFAFPIFPLACVTAARETFRWRRPETLLPLTFSLVGMIFLVISASSRASYLLPLFPAFTLLALTTLQRLPIGFMVAWNAAVKVLFTVAALLIWFIWWGLLHPAVAQSLPWLFDFVGRWLPLGFMPAHSQVLAVMLSIIIAAFWFHALTLKVISPLNTARIWFAAIAVLWVTSQTLLLPWIDETKSYRPVIEQLNDFISHSPYKGACIGAYHLGESIPPMLEYFGTDHKAPPPHDFENTTCQLLFMDVDKKTPQDMDPHWVMVWKGERVLDTKSMEMRLYARKHWPLWH